MNLNEMSYLAVAWYVEMAHGNWLAFVFKDKGGQWCIEHRLRTYVDDKVYESDDRRSWFSGVAKDQVAGEEVHVGKVDMLAAEMAKTFGGIVDRVDVRGEPMAFIEKAKGRSWFHAKTVEVQ